MPITFEHTDTKINIEFIDNNNNHFSGFCLNTDIPEVFEKNIMKITTFFMENYFIILNGEECIFRVLNDMIDLTIKLFKKSIQIRIPRIEDFSIIQEMNDLHPKIDECKKTIQKISQIQETYKNLNNFEDLLNKINKFDHFDKKMTYLLDKMERFESIISRNHQKETFNEIEKKMFQEKIMNIDEKVSKMENSSQRLNEIEFQTSKIDELNSRVCLFETKAEKLTKFVESNTKVILERKWSNFDDLNKRIDILENSVNEIRNTLEDTEKISKIEQSIEALEKRFSEYSLRNIKKSIDIIAKKVNENERKIREIHPQESSTEPSERRVNNFSGSRKHLGALDL